MPSLPIMQFSDPLFRSQSLPVSLEELATPAFQQFLNDFVETCLVNNGAGMGAPQVGVRKRVVVVSVDGNNPRYPDRPAFPLTVLINPRIVKRSRDIEADWEGSLSSDVQALVPRHTWVHVTGLTRDGAEVRLEVTEPFAARVFQHEIGYLNGELFLDLVENEDSVRPLNRAPER